MAIPPKVSLQQGAAAYRALCELQLWSRHIPYYLRVDPVWDDADSVLNGALSRPASQRTCKPIKAAPPTRSREHR